MDSAAGGASMEMEVVDSVSGKQLAASVKKGRGNQFELDHFDELDDIMFLIFTFQIKNRQLETRVLFPSSMGAREDGSKGASDKIAQVECPYSLLFEAPSNCPIWSKNPCDE